MRNGQGGVERVLERLLGRPRQAGLRHAGVYLFGSMTGFPAAHIAAPWERRLTLCVLSQSGMGLHSSPLVAGMLFVGWTLLFGGVGAVPGVVLGALIDARASARLRLGMERCLEIVGMAICASLIGLYGYDVVQGEWTSVNAGLAMIGMVGLAFLVGPTGDRLRTLFRMV
jgi:hypothetical protein